MSKNRSLASSAPAFNDNLRAFLFVLAHTPLIIFMHFWRLQYRSLKLESFFDQLAFYHAELYVLMITLTALWLLPRLKTLFVGLFVATFYLSVFDWASWIIQSKPFGFADLYRTYQIVLYYPEFISAIPTSLKAKLAILLIFPAAGFVGAWLLAKLINSNNSLNTLFPRLLKYSVGALLIVFAGLALPVTAVERYSGFNSLLHIVSSQIHTIKVNQVALSPEIVRKKLGQVNGNIEGKSADSKPDILLFIIETAPQPFVNNFEELIASIKDRYGFKSLRLFENHYTTYPSSDRSIYSILTGKYPPMVEHNNWKPDANYERTLIKHLNENNYKTSLFSTAPLSFYEDNIMYDNIGFRDTFEAETTKNLRTKTENGYVWDREKLYYADLELIGLVEDYLEKTPRNQPIFTAIAPQSSHAPFQCPPSVDQSRCTTDKDKIAANIEWQIKQLGGLIESVSKRNNGLVVVVTGDHGIRSRHESSLFPDPNRIQAQSFHIPLAILHLDEDLDGNLETQKSSKPTSHIDIAPTLLSMIGIDFEANEFHGLDLSQPTSERWLYFIGKGYLPADAFYHNDHFYMENKINGIYVKSSMFEFDKPQITGKDDTGSLKTTIQKELLFLEALLRLEN